MVWYGYDKWSNEEIAILNENYSLSSPEELIELLPNRTMIAIWHKGERLALKRLSDGRFHKGFQRSEESIRKQAKTISGESNVSKRADVKKKISEVHKRNIANGKYNPASWVHQKPTMPEKLVIRLIRNHGFPFNYVGNGQFIIGTLNPDFIHTNEKKVIEVFGRAFHDPEFNHSFRKKIPWYQQYFGRIAYYSQHGYNCLILWDDELKRLSEEQVVFIIKNFLDT